MKKPLFGLLGFCAAIAAAQSSTVLTEDFNYSDGTLTNVSGGVWTLHSGSGVGPLVEGGKALCSETNAADVSAGLAGSPYKGPTLYASFVVNFLRLPSGAGGFFAHLKGDGIVNLRARVFATTNGTGGTKLRVGIGNASSAVPTTIIPRYLDLNTDYFLVFRYNSGTPASTLWIDPGSEGATGDRVDATDSASTPNITRFALRQSLLSGDGMGTLTIDSIKVGTSFADVVSGGDPTKDAPSISSIASQSIPMNAATIAVPFYVIDGETPFGNLTLTADSSNPTLVTVAGVSFTSDGGSNRTVTVTPQTGQQGVSEITVTVTDSDNNTAHRKFLVVVGAPSVSSFANQVTPKNTPTPPIPFTVGDAQGDTLTLAASSTNQALVSAGNISFGGSGSARTVTVTPSPGLAGLTRITVFVSDGFSTVSNSFLLTVFETFGLDLADTFDYPGGSVVTNSAYFWNTHSGTDGQAQVLGGRLYLSSTNSEDISAFMTNGPYLRGGGWILYAGFNVNFASRPTGPSGDFFAHFKDSGPVGFSARVFGTTNGAGAGKFRLGIANSSTTASALAPLDLNTGVLYSVIVRYNVGTAESALWVNPASESDPGAVATDSGSTLDVYTYAFRESSGIGSLSIDDLKVGTSFSDVLSVPPVHILIDNSGYAQITWPASYIGYTLQTSANMSPNSWSDVKELYQVIGNNNLVSTPVTAGHAFFRLKK